MRVFALIALGCVALLQFGCFSTGTKVEPAVSAKIQKGVTTKAEVIALLGNPQSATFIDGGKELLGWSYGKTKINPAIFIPVVGLAVEDSRTAITTFQVIIDQKKVVEDTLWNSAEVGSSIAGTLRVPASKAVYASPDASAAAKQFVAKPGYAKLYVFRESHFTGAGANFAAFLDGRSLGVIASGSFACVDVPPQRHVIRLLAENTQDVAIEAVAGNLYFIKAEPRMGSRLVAVDVNVAGIDEGKRSVSEGRMLALDFDPAAK